MKRVPQKHNTNSFELWKDKKPSLKYFQVWGCLAKVLVREHKRKKLGPKVVDAVFLGNLETGLPSSFSLDDSLASTSIHEHMKKMSNVGVNPSSTSPTHKESDEPRWSKRPRVVKNFGSDFITYNIENDPVTFKDAMASSEAKQWKEAVKSEMDCRVFNGTWELVDLLRGVLLLGEGIDYFDTYSPVARLTTIRVLIALTSVYNLLIHQMHVKTAFLYGELEQIYMDQPEGFVVHDNKRKVYKLVKSLYGLKQAPKQWHAKFDQTILAFGFTVIENDKWSLQYLVNGTRPDPSFSISKLLNTLVILAKSMGSLDRVLRYLKDTESLAIHYGRFPDVIEGYTDAS
ncbi:Retrovirus-related Pol polyprotein from transposon TNT 1-94 [Sesamum angolense]|uniref:Retrovirus-related Pol polyprotein from transposon TNT 1-94 n=1 Tax=Sesamum angolense TaxID=2727404 RepID=A0AAE2BJZ5_9LAMI|nr:Retrovirus-related Pol polyprotein from transposon TNT 1-94 [Sesamum angolense]